MNHRLLPLISICFCAITCTAQNFELKKQNDTLYWLNDWRLPYPVYQYQTGDVDGDGLYVVVEIGGYLYLTRGAVLSYREFIQPIDEPRLTDEEWQKQLESNPRKGVPEWLESLRHHGITHLNLANNHSIDQGREGLMDTKRNIEAAGIPPIGAGANMAEASEPVLLASSPRKVWLVPSLRLALENYAYLTDKPCVSQEPMDSLLNRVHRLRKADSTAVIIVSLHWGAEHKLQTIEEFQGKKIFYSVGNFIFDQPKPINSKACIVRLKVHNDGVETEAIPIEIRNCVPTIVSYF